ncbi:LicD family protein [Flavobacterium phragmitis]|uniref:Lipopolysaccharide cholinephosphotransferase n=1 Tax=Flavobacterium phragmitis TaxID=739143 RepID=A0A1I1NSQ6_9FLAO|nr:LicD family protein [Flavobacterium phragmitis]SFD00649.1 lipopolysaccharide cholinephosphotransferase [Flavobacterium phragmitis]
MEDLSLYNPEGSTLRKAQLRMLEIAIEFDKICRTNNITYWLISGTLLGARRHGGFIPWDDDFDVGVRIEDYDRLLSILEAQLPDSLRLQTKKTDPGHPYFYAKIRDVNSLISEDECLHRNYRYNGLFIDIFPFESIVLSKKTKLLYDSFYSKFRFEFKKSTPWRLLSHFLYHSALLVLPILKFAGKIMNSKYSHAYGIGFYAPHELTTCFPVSKIEFEKYEFSAPNKVDQFLMDEYGDFMKIPSKEKRHFHSSNIELLG